MLTIGGKSNELCKWTTTGRLFRIRIANTLRITTSAKVPVNKLAYKTDNKKGIKMNNEKMIDIDQDLNLESAENTLDGILNTVVYDNRATRFYGLTDFLATLDYEIESLDNRAEKLKYFQEIREATDELAMQRAQSFIRKVFKLVLDHIVTDEHIEDCKFNSVRGMMMEERHILLLEKVLNIRPDTDILDDLIQNLHMSEAEFTHSEVERISSLLNFPIPLMIGDLSSMLKK